MIVDVERVSKILIKKYCDILEDFSIGYPIDKQKVKELIHLLHVLHYASYADSEEALKILAYYG